MQTTEQQPHSELYESNLINLANLVEIAVSSLSSMAGGVISANLNGVNLNKPTLATLVASKLNSKLNGKGVMQ